MVEEKKYEMPDFRAIPQFPHGNYRVDVSWQHLELHLARQFQYGLDLDPDFQRPHVWTEAQQVAYVEYILKNGSSGRELYFNCPGWQHGRTRGEYVIVDGKQRLQAVRRFMAGEIPAFGYRLEDYKSEPDMLSARFSWNIAEVESRAEVLRWYLDFNRGGTVHTQEDLSKVQELLTKEVGNEQKMV